MNRVEPTQMVAKGPGRAARLRPGDLPAASDGVNRTGTVSIPAIESNPSFDDRVQRAWAFGADLCSSFSFFRWRCRHNGVGR